MAFELPALPYPKKALAPYISVETLEFHHGKHHAKYVKTLNELVQGTHFEKMSLEEIIRGAEPGKLFNQASQHWNHTFYWSCMSPDGGKDPQGTLRADLERAFGTVDGFRKKFAEAVSAHFGSGWAWLVRNASGNLAIEAMANAESPLIRRGQKPLLTCDLWEHAFYIDYRNDEARYLDAFWNVVNWDFVASHF